MSGDPRPLQPAMRSLSDLSQGPELAAEGAAAKRSGVEPRGRPAEAKAQVGAEIGNYEVREQLGMNMTGELVRAWDRHREREVILKLYCGEVAPDAETLARMRREAAVLARLRHPHIAEVYDLGDYDDDLYVVSEPVAGLALDRWTEAEPRTRAERFSVLAQIARGLAAAHAEGIVHRDLKPGNILVGPRGRVRLIDFGIARPTGEDLSTSAPDHLGIFESLRATGYLAPEQIQGARVGPAADAFALGVVAFELLTGDRPFRAATITDLANEIVTAPAPVSAAVGNPSIQQLVRELLSKDPEARPPDLAWVADRFAAGDTPPEEEASSEGADRRRWLFGAAAGALALGLSGLAWALFGAGG